MIVIQIRRQKAPELPFVENDDVIQELSAEATDQAFNIGILPGRSRRRDHLIDTEGGNLSPNPLTIDAIAVSGQIPWGRIESKRFYNLLGRPLCRRMLHHVKVENAPSIPSFRSSATIRGESQVGLACHIRPMICRSSGAIGGRPDWVP